MVELVEKHGGKLEDYPSIPRSVIKNAFKRIAREKAKEKEKQAPAKK